MPPFRTTATVAGIMLAVIVFGLCEHTLQLPQPASITAAVIALCGVWWCTEAIPIAVTALVPFAVFPFAGVLDHDQLASAYGDKFVLLFMAGFMISRAAERSKTHLRVSQVMMKWLGTDSQPRIVWGFLLAPAFCSMWISNTATALIMLPVAIAALREMDDPKLAVPLLLAVAYGSSIGGMATIIGTPPNGVLVSIYEQQTGRTIDFFSWLKIGAPVSAMMLVAAGVLLSRGLGKADHFQMQELGDWTSDQRRVFFILSMTAVLWMTRNAPMGGWSDWFNVPMAHDATVGLAAVVLLFLVPSGRKGSSGHNDQPGQSERLLDWETARDIPWGVLVLFGGGIAIAKASQTSGLSESIGNQLSLLQGYHPLVLIGVICVTVTFLTEVTSNVATTTLLMPILVAAAEGAGFDPAVFMIPAALSASCAFMLPVATPPNAIVFGSNQVSIRDMVKMGFRLNLIGTVVITLVCYFMVDLTSGP